jgi:aminopeptidase YwaD
VLVAIVACGGDGGSNDTTASPTATATPSLTPKLTASPTATPDLAFGSGRALEHARVLAEDIGVRAAGTDAERQAAEYIGGELASYGYETEFQPFPIASYETVRSDLSITHAAGASSYQATPLTGSAQGDLMAEVVNGGLGYPEDFPGNAAGRVVLIERGEITFAEKVANATAAGAAAVIVYNNEGGAFGGTLVNGANIPVLSISGTDGAAMRELLDQGAVIASLGVEIRTEEAESQNVVAKPPGGTCRIIAGGHYDSVPNGPGANDNASGTAVVIEIARVLAADGDFDDVCFALFGAEEIGLIGSGEFVGSQSMDGVEAMLNFDMLAVGEGWPLGGTADIVYLAGEVAEVLGLPYRIDVGTGGSDHAPFIAAGIPSVIFNCFCDPNYHTAADRMEFLVEARLGEAGALGLGLLERLLGQ